MSSVIKPPILPALSGDELFVGIEGTVRDFWAFAIPDLRLNTIRGQLAEYLVWRALGIEKPVSRGWDDYDVHIDGIRIEVKSSGYLQAWAQLAHSALLFTGLKSRSWPSGELSAAQVVTYNADVYVFAVHTAKEHDQYDSLDVSQWQFAVLPRAVIERRNVNSLSWASVLALAGGPVRFQDLRHAILPADVRADPKIRRRNAENGLNRAVQTSDPSGEK